MTDWHVGQRVVCTEDFLNGPFRRGVVYTIRSICLFPHRNGEKCGLHLEEYMTHETHMGGGERCFTARYFRPVRETKTDISIFRKLVEPSELAKLKERIEA